jgi:hypothetical protein
MILKPCRDSTGKPARGQARTEEVEILAIPVESRTQKQRFVPAVFPANLCSMDSPAHEPPAPLPPPQCPGCGQLMVLIGNVARKPP